MQQVIKKIKYAGQTKEVYVEYANLANEQGRTDSLVLKSNNVPSEEFDSAFWKCQGIIEKTYFDDMIGKFRLTELIFERKNTNIPDPLHYFVKAKGVQWNHEKSTSFSFDTGPKECYFYEALHNAEGKYTGKNKEFSSHETGIFNRMIELAIEYINGRGLQTEMFDELDEERHRAVLDSAEKFLEENKTNQQLFDEETARLKTAFDAVGRAIDEIYEHGQRISVEDQKKMTLADEYDARKAGAVFDSETKLDELDLFPEFGK